MAPYANILFVHPAVPETVGIQGWPQVAQAIKMIADQHLADVISVSLEDGEKDFINDPTNPAANQAGGRPLAGSGVPGRRRAQHPGGLRVRRLRPDGPAGPRRHRPVHPGDRRHRGSPGRQPVDHRGRRYHPQRRPRHQRPGVPPRTRCGPPRTATPTRRAPASPRSTRSRRGSGDPGAEGRHRPCLPRHLDGCGRRHVAGVAHLLGHPRACHAVARP